jgi:anion-transporting  ArsA/GET3 family ATPase
VTGVLDALADKPVVVVCGAGGVGKTTVAASIGVGLAAGGARVCVVTVDPARRLAGALGIDTASDVPMRVAGEWPGTLHAVQLHAASTFDALIGRHATSDAQAATIRHNPLYRSLASALGGTQEYMAMERLYELHHAEAYDVVVVDTPPTRSALELLDAPERLLRFLGHRVVRALIAPTRFTLRAASAATSAFLRGVAAVVGGELVEDAVAFFQAFAGMQEGFAERAGAVQALLVAPTTAYVLVTTPTADALEEASWFTQHLAVRGVTPSAAVVNRCHPSFLATDPELLPTAEGVAGRQLANLGALERAARHDAEMLAAITAVFGGSAVSRVALSPAPASELDGLRDVARQLGASGATPLVV